MTHGPAVPILRSFDAAEARDVDLRYLGFEVTFEHRFGDGLPRYMGVRLGGCDLHLSEHHGDATPGSAVRIEVADVDACPVELNGRGHPRLRPGVQDQSGGAREIILTDPFGNHIVFRQDIPQ